MYRVRHGRKRWRTKWPWKRIVPLRVDERFCKECGFTFHEGPLPKEVKHFISSDVAALIYPSGSWGKPSLSTKFGRWKANARSLYLSDYFSLDELEDLSKVTEQAHEYILAQRDRRRRSRQ